MRSLGLLVLCTALACGGSSNAPDPEPADPPVGDPGATDPGAPEAAPDKAALCSGAMTRAEEDNDAAWEAVVAKGQPKTLEDLAAAACQLFCGRSTVCAIEDACATMEAAEIADLKLDETAPENTRRCVDQCGGWRLTKEQIQTLGTCAQDQESSCAEFKECAAAAQP